MASLAFIVMGLVINCWNVTLSGLVVPPDWSPGIMGNLFTDLLYDSFTVTFSWFYLYYLRFY
jgi:hypothetical protein